MNWDDIKYLLGLTSEGDKKEEVERGNDIQA